MKSHGCLTAVAMWVLTVFILTGCGSIAGHFNTPPNVPNPIAGAKYYRGVKQDVWCLKDGILTQFGYGEDHEIEELCTPIYIADLPLSCVADTLCLPIDAHLPPATNEPPDMPQKDLPWYLR